MKQILSLLLLLAATMFSTALHAQSGHFDWVKSYSGPDKPGSAASNRILQTEIDSEGNLYVFSECSGSASINGVPLVDHPELNTYRNIIIMKISSTGNIVWKKSISGSPGSGQPGQCIGYGMRLVGDTTVVCLVCVPTYATRLYFIDSLYTDPRSQLFVEGEQYATLTDIITRQWSGLTTREYKDYKGLKKENLRDNITNIEIALKLRT